MAKHGWLASVGLSVGGAAGAAAAQFGIGYGLGIISWVPGLHESATSDSAWLASLAWTTWITATSTVLGAVLADRRSAGEIGAAPPRPADDGRLAAPSAFATAVWRGLLAVSAAVGAMLSVALVLVPARVAIRPDTSTPQLIAAGYAVVGVVLGIMIAVCALSARAAAANAVWTSGWLWLLAIGAVIDGVIEGKGLGSAPLAVWPFGDATYFRHTWSIAGAALMLGAAFLIGACAAWQASHRSESQVGIALSGGLGPILVAVAYFLTAPRLVGVEVNPQMSAYLVAPFAVISGLAGSVLLVAILTSREATSRQQTAELRALASVPPQRPAQPSTADVLAASAARPAATTAPILPATPKQVETGIGRASVQSVTDPDTSDARKTRSATGARSSTSSRSGNKKGRST
jgi:hypothetical protein